MRRSSSEVTQAGWGPNLSESPTRAFIRHAAARVNPKAPTGRITLPRPAAPSAKPTPTLTGANRAHVKSASLGAFSDPNPMTGGTKLWLSALLLILVVADLIIAARVMGWPQGAPTTPAPAVITTSRESSHVAAPTPAPAPAPVARPTPVRAPPASLHISLERGLVSGLFAANADPALADAIISIFSRDWNLRTMRGTGKSVDLLIEPPRQDALIRTDFGRITAARLTVRGRVFEAFRFIQSDGRYGYYRANGTITTRPMLRAPSVSDLVMANLGSRNGWNRSAPSGATARRPVLALVEGVVVSTGHEGDDGTTVEIRHPDGWVSRYTRLDAVKVTRGMRIRPRQIVGEVTENHVATELHYAFNWGHRGEPRPHKSTKTRLTSLPASFTHAVRHARTAWATHVPEAFAFDP